jgi:hypothetical protein
MLRNKLSAIVCLCVYLCFAGCKAELEQFTRSIEAAGNTQPTATETATAIRQALEQGIRQSVNTLGRNNGFYSDTRVRIAVPEDLQKAERLLRKLGQGRYADEFVLSLNRAAEQAVPAAIGILLDALKQMTIADAVAIVRGPEDAATAYFRRTSGAALLNQFKPTVAAATAKVGVTRAYKNMLQKTGGLQEWLSADARDLDGYVTGKAVDALFIYIAEEERNIRQDPVQRGTELLRKVFGYYLK